MIWLLFIIHLSGSGYNTPYQAPHEFTSLADCQTAAGALKPFMERTTFHCVAAHR